MLVDIHTMFFLLLAVWSFLYGLEQGRVWPFLSAFAIVLALFSKYSTWPMLGVLGIITLFSLPAQPKTIIRRSISTAATTFCFLGIIYLWKGGLIQQQLHFLRTYQMAGLQTWQEGYPSAFFFQSHPFIILAALYGTYRAIRTLDKKILIIGWFAALVFFLELKRVRYLIPLIPFIALTASYGLQAIKNSRFQRYIAYSGVVSSVVIALMVYRPFLAETSMANLKEAGRYLNSLASEAVEVYCLPQANSLGNTAVTVPILDMYTDKIIYQEQSWNSAEGARRAQNVSLRFTWELTQPVYYRDKKYSGKKLPLAVIASAPFIELPGPLLEKYPAAKLRTSFSKTSGIYRYQTFVAVFDPY